MAGHEKEGDEDGHPERNKIGKKTGLEEKANPDNEFNEAKEAVENFVMAIDRGEHGRWKKFRPVGQAVEEFVGSKH